MEMICKVQSLLKERMWSGKGEKRQTARTIEGEVKREMVKERGGTRCEKHHGTTASLDPGAKKVAPP
jgi:hypothetical protein